MIGLYTHFKPVSPTGGLLLTEIGIDLVRKTLANDLARNGSDREYSENGEASIKCHISNAK